MGIWLVRWGVVSLGEVRATSREDALAQACEELGERELAVRVRHMELEVVSVQGRKLDVEQVAGAQAKGVVP